MKASDIMKGLQWRAAIKSYNPDKKVDDEMVNQLLEAMNLAPSSFGLQPYKFYVVTDPAVKKEMRKLAWDQPQFTDASHLIVLASKQQVVEADVDKYVENIAETRNIKVEDVAEYAGMMKGSISNKEPLEVEKWAEKQVYIPLGVGITFAAMMEVDTTPMEGFDPEGVGKLIGSIDDGYMPRAILAVGYRAEDDKYSQMAKVRKPLDEIVERI